MRAGQLKKRRIRTIPRRMPDRRGVSVFARQVDDARSREKLFTASIAIIRPGNGFKSESLLALAAQDQEYGPKNLFPSK
jgi:hypothetical protein